jgi:phosphodiesterase/alkaline phosphatase D-like protein
LNKFTAPLLLFIAAFAHSLQAQFITHGPVFGGVTDSSARIYIRTSKPMMVDFQFSLDSLFAPYSNFPAQTTAETNNAAIIELKQLRPATKYYVRLELNGIIDTLDGSFTTFPKAQYRGKLIFAAGSCQETDNMKTFDRIKELNPTLFIHTGDFTYPSDEMNDDYPEKYEAVQESYLRRYSEPRQKEMLRRIPIAYMPDDDDGWGNSGKVAVAGVKYRIDTINGKKKLINSLRLDTFSRQERDNCMKAYREQFPSYGLPADNSYYQSFVVGNCEFIMLDVRTTADCSCGQLDYDSATNHWAFNPKPGNHIIAPGQMAWLKEKLLSSRADWKFIISGTAFNQNIKHLIDIGIKMQDVVVGARGSKATGFRLAASWGYYWAGYKHDSEELLSFIKSNGIKDVIVVSGDSHHSVIDNGANGGLPEINASGLSIQGTILAHYMDKLSMLVAYPRVKKYLWNAGGSGLGNKNFKDMFGVIEVDGNKEVLLKIVDEDGAKVTECKIPHSSQPGIKPFKQKPYQKRLERRYGKKPSGWMKFIKAMARLKYKP